MVRYILRKVDRVTYRNSFEHQFFRRSLRFRAQLTFLVCSIMDRYDLDGLPEGYPDSIEKDVLAACFYLDLFLFRGHDLCLDPCRGFCNKQIVVITKRALRDPENSHEPVSVIASVEITLSVSVMAIIVRLKGIRRIVLFETK